MDQKRRLKGMLARIFSDATAEADERTELSTFLASGALTKEEVKEVVADFVGTTWKITMADGVISDMERARLNEIVLVLGLERSELPEDWVLALRGSVAPTP
jgi:tellurite resistance protein